MKKLYKDKFDKNRRDLLKILVSAGISRGLLQASPLVGGMMLSRLAEAQNHPVNKSVVIYVPNGALSEHWYPNANLTSFPAMSAPYQPVASQCHFLKNMGHHAAGHGGSSVLINNTWGGDSFEVNVGRIIGANHPFRYINLGVHSNGAGYLTKENSKEVPYEDNPFNAFNRFFGTAGGGQVDTKTNIIDAHKKAIDALKNKLGNYEVQRLDSHLTAIQETQQRLIALSQSVGSCNAGSVPAPFTLDFNTFERQAHLQADILATALSCNLTASASIGFGNTAGEFTFPYLNFTGVYHGSIHGGNNGDPTYPHFRETRAHMSSLCAYVIQALQAKGVLDSTIVMEINEMGNGDTHGSDNIPLIFAGGGGAIRRGISAAGGPSYTPLHMIHTAAVLLGANQSGLYQGYQTDVIPGVIV
jgi:hypothetical protein